jgi:hypothetical protein
MTDHDDSTISDAQRDRIARLQARRGSATAGPDRPPPAGPPSRRRRRHPAATSRVVAAGLGAATMFGIVTVLGLDHPFIGAEESPDPPSPPPVTTPAAPPIQVVIHRIPATVAPTSPNPPAPPSTAEVRPDPTAATEPIVLTATPVVRTVTVAGPRQASTTGRSSRPTPQAGSPASAPTPAPAPPAATTSGSG